MRYVTLGGMLWKRLAIASVAALAAGAVVAGCGSDSVSAPNLDPDPPPSDPIYDIQRTSVEVIDGECTPEDDVGDFVGRFAQNGTAFSFSGAYRWEDGTLGQGLEWEGTIDGAGEFTLDNAGHPFLGAFTYEHWTAEGSFNADRSALTATERFRGTLTDARFCESVIAWSGRRR